MDSLICLLRCLCDVCEDPFRTIHDLVPYMKAYNETGKKATKSFLTNNTILDNINPGSGLLYESPVELVVIVPCGCYCVCSLHCGCAYVQKGHVWGIWVVCKDVEFGYSYLGTVCTREWYYHFEMIEWP